MKTKSIIPFLLMTFALTWGIAAILILFNEQVVAIFGEITSSNPLFILAVYSPGISAFIMVWRYYGLKGLGSFLRRLTLTRMSKSWWIFLLLGIPVFAYIAASLNGTINDPFPFSPWTQVFPALFLAFFLGTIEEFGWRGIALPLLQRKLAPFWAGLILGLIWAAWHIPAFLLSGTAFDNWSFIPYFGGVIGLSIILTPMFNNARGSLLIAYLFHFQMMNPIFPDAQPYDSLVFGIVAIAIVIINRRTMFKKGTGVTEILMPGQEAEITSDSDKAAKESLSATSG